ncbi:MAG: YdcF family protein [Meiothermus sp.]
METAAGLSLLLLPVALLLGAGLSLITLALLWLLGTLLGLTTFTFRVLLTGTALVALFIGACLFTPVLPRLAQSLVVSEPPHSADLIVILGGGMHCGVGQLEASSLARVEKGLELWKAGYAPRITLSDVDGEIFGDKSCPSLGLEAQKEIQTLFGTSGPEILLLPQMRTTRTEALATADLAKTRGFRQILLVTTPTHSRRALATFKKLGLEVTSVPSSEVRFDMTMGKPTDRLKGLEAVVREYLGLAMYRLRGWI